MQHLLLLVFCLATSSLWAQQTVGLFLNDSLSYNGYTLFSPSGGNTTYLIDNCGNKVHSWETSYQPGNMGYLLENGNLIRSARLNNNPNITIGGAAGRVELYNWDGDLIWYFEYSDSVRISNHDIQPLPNGNVLMLTFFDMGEDSAIAIGRDSAIVNGSFVECRVIEVQPTGMGTGNIVWEWRASQHVVQDYDSTKPNFAPIASQPHRININYPYNLDLNWLHMNGIDYNPQLDQIILNSHRFGEFWIIDHSTSTAEAAGSTGGNSGKGGDLLYRWGNPEAYGMGTAADKVFYKQHDSRWIPAGYPNEGKITTFNNGQGRPILEYSTVEMVNPPLDSSGNYTLVPGERFGPDSVSYRYTATPPASFYSRNIGGVHALPNGNILVCEGASGRFFELDANDEIVWKYIPPVNSDGIMTQGDSAQGNNVFQAYRYSPDYPAFIGRDLTPQGPIELDPLPSDCVIYLADTTTGIAAINTLNAKLYPNPTQGTITVSLPTAEMATLTLSNLLGGVVGSHTVINGSVVDFSNLPAGLYLYQIATTDGKIAVGKLLKE